MKHFLTYLCVILGIVGILFGADHLLNAQSYDPVATGELVPQISATIVPENPTPGQSVSITLSTFGTDLNNATIAWSVNGTQVQKGIGITQFNVNAGNNGEVKKVTAVISPEKGPSITKNCTISSQEVSIIYEADTYTPPFYKGKSLYGREGSVTLVAMPNLISGGTRLNPATLTYKWIVDGTVQGSKSGYGKNSFVYTGSILGKEATIQVEVTSASTGVTGKGLMLLSTQPAEALVYEKNPLYGIMFNKELSSNGFQLKEKETTIFAVPFSTSATRANAQNLQYRWTLNNSVIPVPGNQNYATFRNNTDQKGSSLIGVSISNSDHLFQQMKNSLSINF